MAFSRYITLNEYTFSEYFVGSGSEDKKGYVWDRHYRCIVAKLPHRGLFSITRKFYIRFLQKKNGKKWKETFRNNVK